MFFQATSNIQRRFRKPLRLAAGLVLSALAAVAVPAAAHAGGWHEAMHSRVRLIAAGPVEAKALAGRTRLPAPLLLAGVEIRLDPGWKTYWRTPGDGIAPHFDWSGAQNVAATHVLWPAPRHFRDAIGAYNGYADRVIFPVVVAPGSPGKPVALDLKLDYAVCKDICIPVSKTLSVQLSGGRNGVREAVLEALRRTPVQADAQGRCGTTLAFDDMRIEPDAQPPRLTVAITHAPGAAPDALFAEAATGRFMSHPERLSDSGDGRTVFRVNLGDGHDLADLKDETITLTAVATPQSCETAWRME